MHKAKCTTITPIIFVRDLNKSIHFYTKVLGFEIGLSQKGYAYIVRDDIAIRLIASEQTTEPSNQSCYICVDGLDDFYKELHLELNKLPENRVRPPFDQPYGQREFHVTDEDGMLIFFGEAQAAHQ